MADLTDTGAEPDTWEVMAKPPSNVDPPSCGLADAVADVVAVLCRRIPDAWADVVRRIAQDDSLPQDDLAMIEAAIAETFDGWSDERRRAVWFETDTGRIDDEDEDDDQCDTSFDGMGYALQIELLDEVTKTAWQQAAMGKEAAARPRRQ